MVQLYTKINIWSIWDHGYIVERSLPSFGLLPACPSVPAKQREIPPSSFWREKTYLQNFGGKSEIFRTFLLGESGVVWNISGGRNAFL
jgi:hypothetical protein